MGDNNQATTFGSSNAPGAESFDKGKGKVAEDPTQEMSMDEEEESEESDNEEMGEDDDDNNDDENLEPISAGNIIEGGRRTRGKNIDFQQAAEKLESEEMDDDDDDDEDFEDDENNNMRQ